ncbi:MAG: hypothetical protein MUP81_06220 [Dehalococcoidia bacterium]|nr:hypothetical protein [Dehalococcoidia bacterium]
MTASYDLTTLIGKVRLKIFDKDVTPATDAHFTDEELQVFLDEAEDDVLLASALALEAWAAELSDSATSERIGDYSYTKKSIDNKLALAERYREASGSGPVVTWAEMDLDAIGEEEEEED